MKVLNDLYDYGLKIYQNSEWFKFSMDSILLAEYIKLKNNDVFLDMCSGNAAILLILSTKFNNELCGMEIQSDVYQLGLDSINYNDLSGRINFINDDVNNFNKYFKKKSFDVISCNPPYFKYNTSSLINLSKEKAISRHEVYFNLDDLANASNFLLKDNGVLYLVHRASRLFEINKVLNDKNFAIKELVFVQSNDSNIYSTILIKAIKGAKLDTVVKYVDIRNIKSYKKIFEEV